MDPRETVRVAARSLRSHKLRSTLTVLGVVVGIAAVITFATVGASLKADIVGEIEGSSANNVYLLSSPAEDEGPPDAPQAVFTTRDVEELRAIEGVRRVVPQGTVQTNSLRFAGDTVGRGQVTATTPAAFSEATFVEGRGFRSGASEVVIDERARSLFERNLSVGDEVTVTRRSGESANVTVVGVVESLGTELPFQNFVSQSRFYLPAEPFYETTIESPTLPGNPVQSAYLQVTVVADPASLTETKAAVRSYLDRSDATQLQPSGYELTAQSSGDIADDLGDLVDRLTRFVTGIAVLSLVVGAIGIANIMLVSVTERTREIGIMKAVGGHNRDVLVLFLTEASFLGALGALIAIPVGLAGGYAATRYAEIAMTLPWAWFGVAVVVGVGVGAVAGFYPAWRAARVDPIDALRRE